MSTASERSTSPITALSPTFAELLLDIHRAIFHHLDDCDFISLLTLSRPLRVIGLVTVITRYGHSRLELKDHIKFSYSQHAELYITTLTCRVLVQNPLAGNSDLMHVFQCILAALSCLIAVTIYHKTSQRFSISIIQPFIAAVTHTQPLHQTLLSWIFRLVISKRRHTKGHIREIGILDHIIHAALLCLPSCVPHDVPN